jgi:hypothetical protein
MRSVKTEHFVRHLTGWEFRQKYISRETKNQHRGHNRQPTSTAVRKGMTSSSLRVTLMMLTNNPVSLVQKIFEPMKRPLRVPRNS